MRLRTCLIRGLLLAAGAPLALVLVAAAWLAALNRTNGSLVSSGQTRTFLLHVPPGLDPKRPAALIVSLHGSGGWPAQQRNVSGWDRLADEQGFLVVYPSGRGLPRVWEPDPGPRLQEDVRFIADLLHSLGKTHALDPRRIYVDGLSNGGGMAFELTRALPGRFVAVGMVAAARSLPWREGGPPVPAILFHGTADPVIPYHGGPSPIAPPSVRFPEVPAWAAALAASNRCAPSPVLTRVARDVTRTEWTGGPNNAPVVFYTLEGGGHTWPGGKPLPRWMCGPTLRSIDATRLMWEFFQAHPGPAGAAGP